MVWPEVAVLFLFEESQPTERQVVWFGVVNQAFGERDIFLIKVHIY